MSKFFKTFFEILAVFLIIFVIIYMIIKIYDIPTKIMKKIYPRDYSTYVVKYSNKYNVDPLLVYAVIKAESNFDKNAVSGSNAKGLMQLMDSTAGDVAGNIIADKSFNSSMLFDPETNIQIGTKYLSELLEKYNGNYYIAVAAYNAGKGTVDRWIQDGVIKKDGSDVENIPYKETNNYVRKIIRDYGIYEKLYQ